MCHTSGSTSSASESAVSTDPSSEELLLPVDSGPDGWEVLREAPIAPACSCSDARLLCRLDNSCTICWCWWLPAACACAGGGGGGTIEALSDRGDAGDGPAPGVATDMKDSRDGACRPVGDVGAGPEEGFETVAHEWGAAGAHEWVATGAAAGAAGLAEPQAEHW